MGYGWGLAPNWFKKTAMLASIFDFTESLVLSKQSRNIAFLELKG